MSADRDANRWAGAPWPEADREGMLAEVRGWLETWRKGPPCPRCGWPYPALHACLPETAVPQAVE